MTVEDYNKWIGMLKTVEIRKGNQYLLEEVFNFSPEKFIRENGLDESFVKEFQKDRKIIHNRLIDYEKITKLKKRKVVPFFDRDDVILFDAKGSKVYSTINEFNKHFVDIREHKINMLLK